MVKAIIYLRNAVSNPGECDFRCRKMKGFSKQFISKMSWPKSHYNPLVSIIDLVSHTTYVVCVNFKWRDLQFKVDSERQIFWETFHGILIYSQSFCILFLMSGLGLKSRLYAYTIGPILSTLSIVCSCISSRILSFKASIVSGL